MATFWNELKLLLEKHDLLPRPKGPPWPIIEVGVTDPCSGTLIDPKATPSQQWHQLCNILMCRNPQLSRGFCDYGTSIESIQAKLVAGTYAGIINLGDDPLHKNMTVWFVQWS